MDKILLQRIKDELAKDPDNKGYAGKDPQAIADLMNSETKVVTPIYQPEPVVEVPPPAPGTLIGENVQVKDAPVLRLTDGIPGIANSISADDVSAALKG